MENKTLEFMTKEEWEEFKARTVLLKDLLDYAVVKEIDNKLLIDKKRVKFIKKDGQPRKDMIKY